MSWIVGEAGVIYTILIVALATGNAFFKIFLKLTLRKGHPSWVFLSNLGSHIQSSAKYRRGNFAEIARRYLIFFPLSDDI